MITKKQINKILFIQECAIDRNLFIKELFKNLSSFNNNKLSKEQFDRWLYSWEATAELDQDPSASIRINQVGRTPRV